MSVKIATWNMAYWSHKAFLTEAWEYFLDNLDCDILLFQESFPLYDKLHQDKLVWHEIGGTRPWGSGIYSSKYNIKEVLIDTKFIGSITAAEIEITEDFKLIVISVYALMEKILNVTYSIPNLHRIFSDLTGLIEGRDTKNRLVIGGDLNAVNKLLQIFLGTGENLFDRRIRVFGKLGFRTRHAQKTERVGFDKLADFAFVNNIVGNARNRFCLLRNRAQSSKRFDN